MHHKFLLFAFLSQTQVNSNALNTFDGPLPHDAVDAALLTSISDTTHW